MSVDDLLLDLFIKSYMGAFIQTLNPLGPCFLFVSGVPSIPFPYPRHLVTHHRPNPHCIHEPDDLRAFSYSHLLFSPTLVLFPEGDGVSNNFAPLSCPGDPKLDLLPLRAGLNFLPCSGLAVGEYGEAFVATLARLEAEPAMEPEMEGVREYRGGVE